MYYCVKLLHCTASSAARSLEVALSCPYPNSKTATMGISHVRQALNAYAPNNSPSLAELLQDVPFSPSFDSVSEHSLYNLYVPSGTADARHHFNQLIHATFTSIYAAPSSWKVRGEVKQWIAVSTPQQMTAAMNSCASDDQIDFLLSCHRGEAITADKLQKLQRIYSGGDSGDVIYMILARPRNVDGRNSWKARYGGNILRPYVGSAERLMKFSGSQRIYEHGVSLTTARLCTSILTRFIARTLTND